MARRSVRATAALAAALIATSGASARPEPAWREIFQSSPAAYEPPPEGMLRAIAERLNTTPAVAAEQMKPKPLLGTVRYRLAVTGSGPKLRIRVSNEDGDAPLRISGASVGLAGEWFNAQGGTLTALTFGGSPGITLAPGAPALSDPVDIAVSPERELVVSLALATPLLNDPRGGAGFVVAPGDQVREAVLREAKDTTGRPAVSGVATLTEPGTRVIVTFGDSITDGNRSKPNELHGWPQQLARRLAKERPGYTVVNAGLGGNRLLAPGWGDAGLARLDRDALRIEGLSHLILLEGINDIGMSGQGPFGNNPEITADDLIAGYRQVIARADARGVKVILGTLLPAGGSSHSSPAKDSIRAAVNHWIRSSGEADAIIDFDEITRDPAAPNMLNRAYDSGDRLHPSEAGYRAMGDAVDLALFEQAR